MRMSKSNYLDQLHLLINQYRGAITKAQRAMMEYERAPSNELLVEQCEHYKRAADLCGQIALRYPRKEDRDEWLENQAEADRQMERIYCLATNRPIPEPPDYFDGVRRQSVGKSVDEPKGSAEPAAADTDASAGKGDCKNTAVKPSDGIPDEVVASWFRKSPAHGFDDIAGMTELVTRLQGCVHDVAAACVKKHMGVSGIHSFFLYGPPGCGKTFIIKAFIHELMKQGYTYMQLSGADIHHSLVGESEKRVERAFLEARHHAPCILFIDEIDSVCRDRNTPNLPNHAVNTTNAFLNGFNSMLESKEDVIFIAATNYPDMVDPAMLDRGKLLPVPLPDLEAIAHNFRMRLEGRVCTEPGFTYEQMAESTENFNYRDTGRLIEELTDAMIEQMRPLYGSDSSAGDAMVGAMVNGGYMLTRETFLRVLSSFRPGKKDKMIRSLDAWDINIHRLRES